MTGYGFLSEWDRACLVHYISQDRAECWAGDADCIASIIGWSSDDLAFYYLLARTAGIPQWDWTPLDRRSDDELIELYYMLYEPDLEVCDEMDRQVVELKQHRDQASRCLEHAFVVFGALTEVMA